MQDISITKERFNYRLFFSLLLLNFIPSISEVVKVLFINTNEISMSVVSQIEWFDLINEVLVAALITPLYSILNKHIKNEKIFSKKVFQHGVLVTSIYGCFLVLVYFYVHSLVNNMFSSSLYETQMAEQYLKLEAVAFLVGMIFSYASVVFIVLGKAKYIYNFIIIKTIFLIISNTLFIPKYGSLGIAYSNIICNIVLSISSLIILTKNSLITYTFDDFKDLNSIIVWIKLGLFQGGSVFVANIVYSNMVVKMINDVQGLGDYWIANNFIWGWLLIPSFALSEVIKSECKEGYSRLNKKSHSKIMLMTICIWVLSIPLWNCIFKYVMGITEPTNVFLITLKLLPFYIAYLFSNYIQSIFQGLGKTEYCLISSLAVNFIYYGGLFILTKHNVITPSLNFAILMFGFGMVFSLIIDFTLQHRKITSDDLELPNT